MAIRRAGRKSSACAAQLSLAIHHPGQRTMSSSTTNTGWWDTIRRTSRIDELFSLLAFELTQIPPAVAALLQVRPYHFDFVCNVKQRHAGRGIVDIFCDVRESQMRMEDSSSGRALRALVYQHQQPDPVLITPGFSYFPIAQEFPALSREYYTRALSLGILRVEGKASVSHDTLLTPGNRMRHLIHRHEPPVPAGPVTVLQTTLDVVAVCKPPGMPVHVAGQYRKNTVLGILTAERPDLGPLLPVHRLDKPVSGVLLFARRKEAADALRCAIAERSVEKVYVARVLGKFPVEGTGDGGAVVADVALGWDPVANIAFFVPNEASKAVDNDNLGQPEGAAGVNGSMEDDTRAAGAPADDAGPAQSSDVGATADDNGSGTALPQTKRRKKVRGARAQAAEGQHVNGTPPSPGPSGRAATTLFRLLAVAPDGQTSVVECRPLTGRTHQIRAHLAWLGHPIANDAQYGGTFSGPAAPRALAAKFGVSWGAKHTGNGQHGEANGLDATEDGGGSGMTAEEARVAQETMLKFRSTALYQAPPELHASHCPHCPYFCPKDYPVDLRGLWLFARRYACDEWAFEAPLPEWAQHDWLPAPDL